MTPALRTAYADPGDSTGLMLWRVTNSWQRAIRAALAPYDLTHVQFVLLAVLASVEDDATVMQRDLAARAGTDPMITSQVIRALERKRLVARDPHPDDGRARVLSPTAAGIDLVNRANGAVEAADAAYFSALGEAVGPFTRSLALLDQAHS